MQYHKYYFDWLWGMLHRQIGEKHNIPLYFHHPIYKKSNLYILVDDINVDYKYGIGTFRAESQVNLQIVNSASKTSHSSGFPDTAVYSVVQMIGDEISQPYYGTPPYGIPLPPDMEVSKIRCRSLRVRYDANLKAFVGDLVISFNVNFLEYHERW